MLVDSLPEQLLILNVGWQLVCTVTTSQGQRSVPAQSQVPVVVARRLGPLHAHRALLIGRWQRRRALLRLPLPVGVLGSLLGCAAGAGWVVLRHVAVVGLLLAVLLGLAAFLRGGAARCYLFAWRFFAFGGGATRLAQREHTVSSAPLSINAISVVYPQTISVKITEM